MEPNKVIKKNGFIIDYDNKTIGYDPNKPMPNLDDINKCDDVPIYVLNGCLTITHGWALEINGQIKQINADNTKQDK